MRFLLSPLIFVLGVLIMKYSVQLGNFTGRIDFAEKYLGSGFGGTFTFYKICGLLTCVLALLWLTGMVHFFDTTSIAPEVP
jgi:hypothetical protein